MVKEKKNSGAGNKRKNIFSLLILIAIIIMVNFVGSGFFKRFDLTSEKRYTLAASTRALLNNIEDEVYLKIYLEGDFNPSFARLKNETREILDEFRAYSNNHIQYEFIRPGEGLTPEEAQNIEKQLYDKGIIPEEVTERKKTKHFKPGSGLAPSSALKAKKPPGRSSGGKTASTQSKTSTTA